MTKLYGRHLFLVCIAAPLMEVIFVEMMSYVFFHQDFANLITNIIVKPFYTLIFGSFLTIPIGILSLFIFKLLRQKNKDCAINYYIFGILAGLYLGSLIDFSGFEWYGVLIYGLIGLTTGYLLRLLWDKASIETIEKIKIKSQPEVLGGHIKKVAVFTILIVTIAVFTFEARTVFIYLVETDNISVITLMNSALLFGLSTFILSAFIQQWFQRFESATINRYAKTYIAFHFSLGVAITWLYFNTGLFYYEIAKELGEGGSLATYLHSITYTICFVSAYLIIGMLVANINHRLAT